MTAKNTSDLLRVRRYGSVQELGWNEVTRVGPATVRAFEFLSANTRLVPKVTLPAPILVHMYACGNQGVLEGYYKDLDQFWSDVIAAYRQEVDALVASFKS